MLPIVHAVSCFRGVTMIRLDDFDKKYGINFFFNYGTTYGTKIQYYHIQSSPCDIIYSNGV